MKNFCISHSKDVDGIGAAALVVAARGGDFRLTGYDEILQELELVPSDTEEFVLCDIGTDRSRVPMFVRRLGEIAKFSRVTYIDHHYLEAGVKRQIRRAGVNLIHDTRECASMLTYRTFRDELPPAAKSIALYGAVTDYMDTSPMAKKLVERSDRHFVLLEATLLSSSLAVMGDDPSYPRMLVQELSKMRQPHEIDEVPIHALEHLKQTIVIARRVRREGKRMKRIAYVETREQATGNVAKLLLEAFDVPVGVAFREKNERGWYEVSFRGTSDCKVHLGLVVGRLVEKFGGSGGGHRLSAGCRIPKARLFELLEELDKRA